MFRVCRRRSLRSTRARETCWRSSADRTFATTPFNRAVRSHRQPGSAFKPFVYAAALEQGLSPVSTFSGLQQVAVQAPEGVWIPRDERAKTHDTMTLREALLESSNAAAVLLQQRVGARPVLKLANDLGVPNQPDVPSLALGSGLVTPLDLTAAYAVFPGMGYRSRPRGVVSVEDADGDQVEYVHIQREQVLSEQVAFQMVSMLQDVARRGTAASLQRYNLPMEVGGKTGTTNDSRDAWFVGFSSDVVAGVWVGFDRAADDSQRCIRVAHGACRSGRTSCVERRVVWARSRSCGRLACALR